MRQVALPNGSGVFLEAAGPAWRTETGRPIPARCRIAEQVAAAAIAVARNVVEAARVAVRVRSVGDTRRVAR